MTTLTTVTYIHEADLLCMKLGACGIGTFVPDQSTAVAQPLYGNAIGGIRVQVDEADLERAREVLADDAPHESRGMFECPECRSDSVEYERVSRRFAFLSLLLLGIPLLWVKKECRCTSCGHRWKEG